MGWLSTKPWALVSDMAIIVMQLIFEIFMQIFKKVR